MIPDRFQEADKAHAQDDRLLAGPPSVFIEDSEHRAYTPPADDEPPTLQPAIYRLGIKIYRTIQLCVTGVLLFALLYGWHWLSDPTEFPVKAVKIQAPYTHVDQQTLQTQILPYVNQGFIRLNTDALKKQLLQFTWLAHVDIKRIWPDTLVIQLIEQEAIARWGAQSLLNTKGEIFTPPVDTLPQNLPLLNGPLDQVTNIWTLYTSIMQILKPLDIKLHKFNMDERLSLELELANGTRILLGKTDPLLHLQRFVKVYSKIFASSDAQAESVDLRYENGLSIKWRNRSTLKSEKP